MSSNINPIVWANQSPVLDSATHETTLTSANRETRNARTASTANVLPQAAETNIAKAIPSLENPLPC